MALADSRWSLSLPFFVATVVVVFGIWVGRWVEKKTKRAVDAIAKDIETSIKKTLSLPDANRTHFEAIAAWTADAASTFVSVAGLIASTYLLYAADSAPKGLYYVLGAVAIGVVLVSYRILLTEPADYSTRQPSSFQIAIAVANVVVGVGILALPDRQRDCLPVSGAPVVTTPAGRTAQSGTKAGSLECDETRNGTATTG